ncbi:MAG: hypothetical protein V1704_01905 [Candidatus Vogelbacteria bacterium]
MKEIIPVTSLGKWSVGLNAFFLIAVGISCVLVLVLKVLNFNDHWWDVTVPILALTTITAFILGLMAIIKHRESSVLVYASVVIGLLAILFIFLHSLFIND